MKSKLGVKMRKSRGVPFRSSQAFQQFQSKNPIDADSHLLKMPIPQQEMGIQMLKMMEEMEKSKKLFRERMLRYRQSKPSQGTQEQQQHALDDFEDDEGYYDSEVQDIFSGIQDEDYEDDDGVDYYEQGEDQDKKEHKRQFITHHKLKFNPHSTKLYDQDKLEPLFQGDFFRACAYKLSLAVVLLGCILSLYLLYEYMQPQTQSRLKEHIAYEVINHHGVLPSHSRSQIFTQHSYLDYPFQLYSFVDQQFAKFLASGSPKKELFFNEQFVPLLFVPGSGQETDTPASINHLDQRLQELVGYEIEKQNRLGKLTMRESQERNKLFKFYSLDFQEALSAFSIAVIEKETVALMRAILYISTRTQEKIILICNQMGGLSCLGALAALQDEHLAQISQVIFLNSPIAKHPIDSHFAFINKYKSLYKSLSQRIHNLQSLRILSFSCESQNSEIFQLNLPLKNSLFLKMANLRDVFTDLPGDQPLSSPPFLNLLSKYFILDYYHKRFNDGGIDSINNFFTQFETHYEDSFDKRKFSFSKITLDKRCGRIIPTFEKTVNTDLLSKGRRVEVQSLDKTKENHNKQAKHIKNDNKKKYQQDQETNEFSYNQSLLCVKIATSHIRASNLVYTLHTNLLSQDVKVFTFKQQKGMFSKQTAVEISPQFSFFFGTVYLHQQAASSHEIYVLFSTKNNTFLHKEYSTFYKQQTPSEQLFLSISNFQSSGNTLPPFIRPTKDEWQSHKQVFRARFQDFEEIGMYRYCSFQGISPNLMNKSESRSSEHDWNRRDFSLLLLRDSITGRVITTSFSYAERDCNYVHVKKQNKENTENELLFFRFVSNNHQDNAVLTHSSDIGAYARWMGAFLKPILLNSHASLCCVLLVIQIRHFQIYGQAKVPSQLSILLHKLPSIATFEILSIFFGLTFQQSLLGDDNSSNSSYIFANSIFTAFIVSLAIISTYILIQVGFQMLSLLSFVCCSLAKLLFFRLTPVKLLQTSPYFHFFNAHTLLMPLVFLTNSPFKWIAVFIIFWLLLGFAQANRSLSLNILHGFAYLVLINFILNSHNQHAAFIRLNSTTDQTKFRSLLAADEFTSDFFTMVCWLFILARVHHLVASSGSCLQFLFTALGLIISFHTFRSVAPTNEYLCNFSYLLMLLTLYNHSSKEQSPNPKTQQTQQLQ